MDLLHLEHETFSDGENTDESSDRSEDEISSEDGNSSDEESSSSDESDFIDEPIRMKKHPSDASNIPELKEIAFLYVALSLWSHVDIPYAVQRRHRGYIEWSSLLKAVHQSTNSLPVPEAFIEIIKKYVTHVMSQIDRWVSYHFDVVLLKHGKNYDLYCLFDRMIWNPCGTIDYKQTARNVLNSSRLNDVEKYRFCCAYCLVEEIDLRWSVLVTDNAIDCVDFPEYPLIYYWNSYCKNELHRIPETLGLSLPSVMFRHPNVNNWPAKEYFFDRIASAEEQVQSAVSLIDEYGLKYQKLMLKKLNNVQRSLVYMERAVQIVGNYLKAKDHFSDVLSTWYDIRGIVSTQQFVLIFIEIVHKRSNDVLAEIWITASDELRIHLLNFNNDKLIKKVWDTWKRSYNDDVLALLLDSSMEMKKQLATKRVFVNYCAELIRDNKISILKRMLLICFPKYQGFSLFKRILLKKLKGLDECCKNLIAKEDISSLERLITLFYSQTDEMVAFKCALIKKDFFKKSCQYLIDNDKLSMVKRLLIFFLPCTQKLILFKRDIIRACDEEVTFEKELHELDQLLNACFSDTCERMQFKKVIVFNSIAIADRVTKYYQLLELKTLNHFLVQLLSSTEIILEYKKQILTSPDCIAKLALKYFNTEHQLALNEIIADSFTTADVADEFKKQIVITWLNSDCFFERLSHECKWSNVKQNIESFVLSQEDRKILKAEIFKIVEKSTNKKNSFKDKISEWYSVILWCIEDDINIVKGCNSLVLVDAVFDILLNECIFLNYDDQNHRIARYTLKNNFTFDPLDKFLVSYFKSSNKIRKYKLQRVYGFKNMKTVEWLLKEECSSYYVKKLMNWFFKNDTLEMSKFKRMYRGEKITKMVQFIPSK